ncbi:hypothetical protein S245_067813, partial [Arachis hypogaea]
MSKEQKLNKSFQEELKILKLDRDKMEKNEIEAALETSRKSLAANVLSSASQMSDPSKSFPEREEVMELARKVFKDGRDVDLEGLKTCMTSGYSYIEGIEHLLLSLKRNNYEMHAFTNYPICVKGHTFQEPSCRFVFVSVEDGYLQSGCNQAVAIHDGKCEFVAYWRKFVAEYYSPRAKERWCLSLYNNDAWQCDICGSKSGRGFGLSIEMELTFQMHKACKPFSNMLTVRSAEKSRESNSACDS